MDLHERKMLIFIKNLTNQTDMSGWEQEEEDQAAAMTDRKRKNEQRSQKYEYDIKNIQNEPSMQWTLVC